MRLPAGSRLRRRSLAFFDPAAAFLILALGLFGGLAGAAPARAVDYTVTTTAGSGPGSLRAALAAANSSPGPDTITFAVTGTIALTGPLPIVEDSVTLQGPGAGALAINGANLYRILDISPTITVTVADLSLVGARAPSGQPGGAIRSRGDLQLLRVDLHGNQGNAGGSAVYGAAGSLHIAASVVQSNTANAVYAEDTPVAITGTVLAYNAGSALTVDSAPALHITATQIISNGGRGIEVAYSDTDLTQVLVSGNGSQGAAILGATLSVRASVLAGNHGEEGGGIYVLEGAAILTDTLLQGNAAKSRGGAIYLSPGSRGLTMTNSTIRDSTAPYGAGIYAGGGDLQIRSSALLANVGDHGPAIYLDSPQTAVVTNSCIANNWVTSAAGVAVEFPISSTATLSAPNNWWGAADGPSGAGPGTGDSVDAHVLYAPYQATPPDGCPLRSAAVQYLPSVRK